MPPLGAALIGLVFAAIGAPAREIVLVVLAALVGLTLLLVVLFPALGFSDDPGARGWKALVRPSTTDVRLARRQAVVWIGVGAALVAVAAARGAHPVRYVLAAPWVVVGVLRWRNAGHPEA